MDVGRIHRVARGAIETLMRFATGLAYRLSASERAIDQISSEQQSYFRRGGRAVEGRLPESRQDRGDGAR
jgi:hypothetical protein